MSHFVYIVRCADQSLYTGYATDVEKRLREHNGDTPQAVGAKYTRGRGPVVLVYKETCTSRSEALKREYAIKQLPRSKKLLLIQLFHDNIFNKVT